MNATKIEITLTPSIDLQEEDKMDVAVTGDLEAIDVLALLNKVEAAYLTAMQQKRDERRNRLMNGTLHRG